MQRRDYGSSPSGLMSKRAERALREQQLHWQLQPASADLLAADDPLLSEHNGSFPDESCRTVPAVSLRQHQSQTDMQVGQKLQEAAMRQQVEAMAPRKRRRLSYDQPESSPACNTQRTAAADSCQDPDGGSWDGQDMNSDISMGMHDLDDSAIGDWGRDHDDSSPRKERDSACTLPEQRPTSAAHQRAEAPPRDTSADSAARGLTAESAAVHPSAHVYPWGRGDASVVLHCDVNCYYCQVLLPSAGHALHSMWWARIERS